MTSLVLMLVNLNLIENLSKDKDRLEAQQLTFEPLNAEPRTFEPRVPTGHLKSPPQYQKVSTDTTAPNVFDTN